MTSLKSELIKQLHSSVCVCVCVCVCACVCGYYLAAAGCWPVSTPVWQAGLRCTPCTWSWPTPPHALQHCGAQWRWLDSEDLRGRNQRFGLRTDSIWTFLFTISLHLADLFLAETWSNKLLFSVAMSFTGRDSKIAEVQEGATEDEIMGQ